MPELPEVETIRRGLAPKICGRKILRAEVRLKKQVRGGTAAAFEKAVHGRAILALGRRAKFLLFQLDAGLTILAHLGMSGQITFVEEARPCDKHTHLVLYLQGGGQVRYRDVRQFGYWRMVKTAEVSDLPSFKRLGLEPLAAGFTWPAFLGALSKRRGGLKALLLSQAAVVGLGNIYADEACFRAGLHPLRKVESFGQKELRALYEAIPAVLQKGLGKGGTTLRDYRRSDGSLGQNQNSLQAYGRSGQPCLRCGAEMKKTQVSQRTTVFCPRCQRAH